MYNNAISSVGIRNYPKPVYIALKCRDGKGFSILQLYNLFRVIFKYLWSYQLFSFPSVSSIVIFSKMKAQLVALSQLLLMENITSTLHATYKLHLP